MKLKAFSVFDEKAAAFSNPFFVTTHGQAERAFGDMVMNPEHQFGQHPEDFTLFEIGDYDDNDGTLSSIEKRALGTALEFKARLSQE